MINEKYRVKNTKTGTFISKELSCAAATKLFSALTINADHYEVVESEDEKVKQLEEAPAEPREMDADEIDGIKDLHKVSALFNDHKKFSEDMYSRILTDEKLITEKQAAYLWYLIFRYRRQMPRHRIVEIAEKRRVY